MCNFNYAQNMSCTKFYAANYAQLSLNCTQLYATILYTKMNEFCVQSIIHIMHNSALKMKFCRNLAQIILHNCVQ